MAGRYEVLGERVRFTPAFPLAAGIQYQAVLRPDRFPGSVDSKSVPLLANFRIPLPTAGKRTTVTRIEPSASVLPENLLKFYLHFSAPMSRGQIYDHIHLRNARGQDVELPFLEIHEELWNPDMTRLTLFLDPGRIKRGVKPLEEIGPSLEQGKEYALVIDPDWQDGKGRPLRSGFIKRFRVAAPDREPPDPNRWRVLAPGARSRSALRLRMGEALDAALALRLFQVTDSAGAPVSGSASLHRAEQEWRFIPDRPWVPGIYRLVIPSRIEDLAGNNIDKPFDVDLQAPSSTFAGRSSVTLSFTVQ